MITIARFIKVQDAQKLTQALIDKIQVGASTCSVSELSSIFNWEVKIEEISKTRLIHVDYFVTGFIAGMKEENNA
jgi:uncharacterized protein involved in tolerance to divalent cations